MSEGQMSAEQLMDAITRYKSIDNTTKWLKDAFEPRMAEIAAMTSVLEDRIDELEKPIETVIVLGAAMQLTLAACDRIAKHNIDRQIEECDLVPDEEEEAVQELFTTLAGATAVLIAHTAQTNQQWEQPKQS